MEYPFNLNHASMKPFASAFLLLIAIISAVPAQALQCGWVPVASKYCSENLELTGQDGYTTGEDFKINSKIGDDLTRKNSRNLPPGATDIFVDAHGICRYLSSTSQREIFVPFLSSKEWVAYLNNQSDSLITAIPCAPDKSAHLSSVCSDVAFNWIRGKQGDTQTADFAFERSRDWKLQKVMTESCSCTNPGAVIISKKPDKCVCDYCGDTNTHKTTTCDVSMSWQAEAEARNVNALPAGRSSVWEPDPAPSGDCDPPKPDKDVCQPKGTNTCIDGILKNSCGNTVGSCGPVDGECGGSNDTITTDTVPPMLCNKGIASTPILSSDNQRWTWQCKGDGSGTKTASCQTSGREKVDGECGASNGATTTDTAPAALCNKGTATFLTLGGPNDDQHWSWQCPGENDGNTASCRTSERTKPCLVVNDQVCSEIEIPVDNGTDADNCPKAKTCKTIDYPQCNAKFPGWTESGCGQCGENWDWWTIYHPDPRCCAIELVPGCPGYVDPNPNPSSSAG